VENKVSFGNAERHQRLFELIRMALDADPAQRAAFLDQACAGDPELRREMDRLLTADTGTATASMESAEGVGRTIGPYRLLQKIGEGGMGVVWLADQAEPVRRRVALKLIKAGMSTHEVIARFESERQALALMDHPAIARVFDAGTTLEGSPYFVMEYIAGVPITTYCDNRRLGAHQRLEVFLRVCEGVQHAHQKAIIHRDLKPSNILVTEVAGRATPKIIDFGVVKALSQKLTEETVFTRFGALIGTPEYMSPEQANSLGEDIDTRTDVYSLGVILYELLAGAPPIDSRTIAFEEFLRRLREEAPPKPSARIGRPDATEVARNRQSEPPELARLVRGDLDSIALKALEKDRSRRYGSASDLAADVGRYLRNEAVLAVSPSVAYLGRKLVRRYRSALVTACAFVLVLIVAAVMIVRQSVRANREAAVTDALGKGIHTYMLGMRGIPSMTDLLKDFAAMHQRQGQYAIAGRETLLVLMERRRTLGSDNPVTMAAAADMALARLSEGNFHSSEWVAREALEFYRKRQPDDWQRFRAESLLGASLAGQKKYAEAEPLLLEGYQGMLARKERIGETNRSHLDRAREWIVQLYQAWGKSEKADEWKKKHGSPNVKY